MWATKEGEEENRFFSPHTAPPLPKGDSPVMREEREGLRGGWKREERGGGRRMRKSDVVNQVFSMRGGRRGRGEGRKESRGGNEKAVRIYWGRLGRERLFLTRRTMTGGRRESSPGNERRGGWRFILKKEEEEEEEEGQEEEEQERKVRKKRKDQEERRGDKVVQIFEEKVKI